MVLILLGAPGAGKGSQARELAKYFVITQVSTGDILRQHMADNTELGARITKTMNSGDLVADDIIIDIVRERLKQGDCKDGYILDGFPRTLAQARALREIFIELATSIFMVISIEVPDEVIVERMSGRLVCPDCSAMFHKNYYPPKKEGVCDNCGSHKLSVRDDDKAHTVLKRLETYHALTEPIIDFYDTEGLLIRANGVQSKAALTKEIIRRMEED